MFFLSYIGNLYNSRNRYTVCWTRYVSYNSPHSHGNPSGWANKNGSDSCQSCICSKRQPPIKKELSHTISDYH